MGAQVGVAFAAALTLLAGNRRIDRDDAARIRTIQRDPAHLMPWHQRILDGGIPDPTIGEPMQIRSAQPHGPYLDQRLAVCRDGGRFLPDANVLGAPQSRCPHVRPRLLTFELVQR